MIKKWDKLEKNLSRYDPAIQWGSNFFIRLSTPDQTI